ncbi:helix-hairpin-helix domain-containing protein [uncultured Bacteroides sp.]|uniref:helix-hairpin-helix domain-containing protein n=1 Tax=uncultured Bacteroides sp. TaxID=162156 RepID=UPI002587A349|nr:helix-hairpin-helix domain-containing protein [uncultured Bacteroides sp.]
MKLLKSGVFLSMLLITPVLEAQNTTVSLWEENIEQLSMDEEEKNWEDELEELSNRLQEPVNINVTTKHELEQFPFLSDIQIENILAYVYIHGQMQTIYELQLVEEMDKRTIDLLLPFVCVHPVAEKRGFPRLKSLLKYGKQEVLTRLDVPFYTRKGYQKNYLGPSMYHSLRYGYRYGDYLQMGVTAEKDAGEPLFALHNGKGYDYYSIYFLLRNLGRLKTLAVGNYKLSFGQGLVVSTDFRLGKTYSLSTLDNRSGGIRKHSSTDEYNYFRGAAATVEIIPALQISGFYSHRSMDGVVEQDEITSIYKTGLHRTEKEAEKMNAFTLQLMGGNINYEMNNLKVGLTGIYYFFSHTFQPELRTYAKYNMQGNNFYNAGIDYKYRLNRFILTGEAAMGKRGYSLLNQLKYNILTGYQLSIVHRYYTHDYWAMFACSFGESSTPQNENGWYMAAEAAPFAHWKFFASLDLFSFPWWKYRISKPSQGVDAMFQSLYSPKRNLSMYINYRYKRKERDVAGTNGKVILPTYYHRLRYRLTYSPDNLQLRTTVDYNHFHSQGREGSQGYQLTQSCSYVFSFPLKLSVQGTYFHTDDYDSRIYASEKGLLYTFYTPSFYGQGFRFSACARYDMNKAFMLLVKFGQTIYQDRETIGSGNDLIQGNKKADLQMQLRIKI